MTEHAARFAHQQYLVRRKFLKLLGAAFYVDDPSGQVILYANQKAFKLKEDIRLYMGEDMQHEVLRIHARSIIDLGATYDVIDAPTGQKIGAIKRQGLKSLIQDEWTFFDAQDREMGSLKEESTALAIIRRFVELVTYFLPQEYIGTVGNRTVCHFKQMRNPFLMKIQTDFSADQDGVLDRRLGLAAAILLCAIEGKQR